MKISGFTNITFYGADWCSDCRRAKEFLIKNDIDFKFVDVEIDEAATRKVEEINNGKRIIPTVIINGKQFPNPPNDELADLLGMNPQGRVLFFGADWCPDCRRAKQFLQDRGVNYQFLDIEDTEGAASFIEGVNNGKRIIPTLLINGEVYANPDNPSLQKILKLDELSDRRVYDSVIVGGGAAGLTASIYAQRDRFSTLILERKNIGGNAFLTGKIENYPGFINVSGPDLMDRMADQATTYGATVETGVEVKGIRCKDCIFHVDTNMGTYYGRSVVVASGSTYRTLGIPGEGELIGSGVHFCATCDGAFYRDREIIVVGGGNSALEEGIFLAGFCKKVTIINRSKQFSASDTYIEKLPEIDNIETRLNKKSVEFTSEKDGSFKGLRIKDNDTGETEQILADGAFIFIGMIPNTDFLKESIHLDETGYVVTEGLNETSEKGMFAAGDCRKGAIAQVAAATGEGVIASYGIKQFLSKR
jgi:thioredoxin reductase (NADPH)